MQEIDLATVKFGHEHPGSSLNVRVHERDADQKQLMASIQHEGLLQPMLAMKNGVAIYVIDGNRRLAALKKLGQKKIPESWLHIVDVETPDSAVAKALAANIQRVPLHEVDRFEAFSALNEPTADIARMFGTSELLVRRSLALGKLAPEIRKLWREDKIRAGDAMAFTVEPDQKKQVEVLHRLKKQGNVFSHAIKQALVGNQRQAARLLAYVGKDAYLAAGGTIGEDLFAEYEDDRVHVGDVAKLEEMAKTKLDAAMAEIKEKQGWGWVARADDLPANWEYSWPRAEHKNKKDRVSLGCVVTITGEGHLDAVNGVVRPSDKKTAPAEKAAAGEKEKPATATVTAALGRRLEEQAGKALQDALVQAKGNDVALLIAKICASMIVPHAPYQTPHQLRDKMGVLRDAIPPLVMQAALVKRFDRKDYFASAPKALVLKAIAESGHADVAKDLAKKTRAEIAKVATTFVAKTWLPPQLRNKGYKSAKART